MLRTYLFAVILVALTTIQLLAATRSVAIVADVSGSMDASDKLAALQEGAKLAIALVDGQVVIVPFSSHAVVSPAFQLTTEASRHRAMAYVDRLTAGGGTNYLAALSKLAPLPPGTPTVFISDGANGHGSHGQVLALAGKAPGPIYTIAVDASGDAQKLLTEIAAKTGGSAVSVDDAEELTKAILAIAQRLGGYHAHAPAESILNFPHCQDTVIAIGYDAVPGMTGAPPFSKTPFHHEANLRNEHVVLSRVMLHSRTTIEIRTLNKRKPSGRLARVLRSDLLKPELRVSTADGKVAAGSELTVSTEFTDRDGNRIDPRTRPDLQVEYGLQDGSNKTIVRKLAVPSATHPSLTATLPLPDKPGPITVTQKTQDSSSGAPFYAEDQMTVLTVQPIRLTAVPDKLVDSPKTGRFSVQLTVKPADGRTALGAFSAKLLAAPGHLSLIKSESRGDVLQIDLHADRHGMYRGELQIHGNAATPVSPLTIPFQFDVRPRHLGLALPATHDVNLGMFVANSGRATVATWSIPSRDTESPPKIEVRLTDLTNGSSVIPLRSDHTTITPVKDAPARLELIAEIGNVPAGVYRGTVTYQLADSPVDRQWETNIQVTVTDPVSMSPIDFGQIEIGTKASEKLLIRNVGAPLRDVPLSIGPFVQGLSRLGPSAVSFNSPDRISLIRGNSETTIDVSVTLSPFLQSRGRYEASLALTRADGQHIQVPVRIDIAGKGEGRSQLLVAPAEIRLAGKPDEVVKFTVRVKLADVAAPTSVLSLAVATFEDAEGRPQVIDADFIFPAGAKLSPKQPVAIDGFVIAPSNMGLFTGAILVRSTESGTKRVPVTIDIK